MEHAFQVLLAIVLLLSATQMTATASLALGDGMYEAWRGAAARAGEQSRTRLTVISAETDQAGANLYVRIRNDGQTRLSDYSHIDFIVRYVDLLGADHLLWMPYSTGAPGANQWTVSQITPDAFEPGIVNLGEEVTLWAVLVAPVAGSSQVTVVVGTPQGVSVSTNFVA